MTLSAQDIQRMSLLAMNAEMEPGHRFVNDLGDALQDALDEIERLREQVHAPLRDWTPDLKRWLADVLLKEASEVDGDEPRSSREMVYALRLDLHRVSMERDVAKRQLLDHLANCPPAGSR